MTSDLIILIILSTLFVLAVLLLIWARYCGRQAEQNRTAADELWKRISSVTRSSRQLRRQLSRFEGAKSTDFSTTVMHNLKSLNAMDDHLDQSAELLQLLLLESPDKNGYFVRNDYVRLYRVASERRKLAQLRREVTISETYLNDVQANLSNLYSVDDTIRGRAQQLREISIYPTKQLIAIEKKASINVNDWDDRIQKYDQQLQHIIQEATGEASFKKLDQLNSDLEMLTVAAENLQKDIDANVIERDRLDKHAAEIYQSVNTVQFGENDKNNSYVQHVTVLHQYTTTVMSAYPDFRSRRQWELTQQTLSLGKLLISITQSLYNLAPVLQFLTTVCNQAEPKTAEKIKELTKNYNNAQQNCVKAIEEMPTLPGYDESGVIDHSLHLFQSLDDEAKMLQNRHKSELNSAVKSAQHSWEKAQMIWIDLGHQLHILPEDSLSNQYNHFANEYHTIQKSPLDLKKFIEKTNQFIHSCEQHKTQIYETREWAQNQQKVVDTNSTFILSQQKQYACFERYAHSVQTYQADYNQLLIQLNNKQQGWVTDDFYDMASQLLDLVTRIRETTEQVQTQHDQLQRIYQDIGYPQGNVEVDQQQVDNIKSIKDHINKARKATDFEMAQKHLQDGRYVSRKVYH